MSEQEQPEPTSPEPAGTGPSGQPASSTSDGLDPKIGGLLAYLLFMWIGGLIMLLTQKHPEVKFHGAQSVLTSIAFFVVAVGLTILSTVFAFIPGLGFLTAIFSFLLSIVLSIGGFVLWVFLCIKGYNLDHFKLPLIGDMAERWAGQ